MHKTSTTPFVQSSSILQHAFLMLLVVMSISLKSYAQINYYQDIFHGGVTGDGIQSSFHGFTQTFNIHIEPGSTIKKGFLFVNSCTKINGVFNDTSLIFNNHKIHLNTDYCSSDFLETRISPHYTLVDKIKVFDVTSFINTFSNSNTIITPKNYTQTADSTLFGLFYLLVFYENPSMPLVSSSVFLNNYESRDLFSFNFINLNPIKLNKDVGFTFMGWAISDNPLDGSFVSVNEDSVGLVGGQESSVFESGNGGVRGSFYYQNDTLHGIGNDTADSLMNGVDALCNISPYLQSNNQFNVDFKYEGYDYEHLINYSDLVGYTSNPIYELFTMYATTCDTFSVHVPRDTTLCKGQHVQLVASGGQHIKWEPSTGLSCDTCYTPIFSGDKSTNYTVRFWNNDSCSIVRTVQVNVASYPSFNKIDITTSDCSAPTGKVVVTPDILSDAPHTYTLNSHAQPSNTFSNIQGGTYSLIIADRNGCAYDTSIVVPDVINVKSTFDADPSSGVYPLFVMFDNNTTGANHYDWYLNGSHFSTSYDQVYYFKIPGTYTIQLIAWKNKETCADTFSLLIHVFDSLVAQIPNVFTPNNDGINDVFSISLKSAKDIHATILNRWGNVVHTYSNNDLENPTTIDIWDGKIDDTFNQDRVYYYVMEITDILDKKHLIKGFFQVE